MKTEKIFHYEVQAYDKQEGQALLGVVLVDINTAKDEKEALEIAKTKINRPFYRVCKVWECHNCNNREKSLKSPFQNI
jgi:hypothetical protein